MQIESCDQFESAKPVALEVPPSSIARADEVFELDRLILWHADGIRKCPLILERPEVIGARSK
jgi:hypothetical protein